MDPITNLTDRALVEAFLLTRDEWVFKLIYRRHVSALWRLALYFTAGNEGQAADLLQDVWMRSIEKLPHFRWESGLRTWLTGFMVMRAREHRRFSDLQIKRFTSLETASDATLQPDFNPEILDLETALNRLSPGFRAVLTLHDLEGFKHEEIAGLLGISIGTSKSQLSRARAAMRHFFMQSEGRP